MKILLVEDETKIASFIKRGLEESGHVVDLASDGKTALKLCGFQNYDMAILDIMLPDFDGLKVLKGIREDDFKGPILMLTALSDKNQVIKALDSGADDYLTKPFDFNELKARIRALMRRGGDKQSRYLEIEDLTVDLMTRKVTRGGKTIELSAKEFSILEYLLRNKGRPITRTQLLEHVWNMNFDPSSNVTDVYINMLRKKVDNQFEKKLIRTVVGVGYTINS